MPTDNPKVSAYVPQRLKDRLSDFRTERSVSESQAVTIILAEYFGLPQMVKSSEADTEVGGVTVSRVESLENAISTISKELSQLRQQVDFKIGRLQSQATEVQTELSLQDRHKEIFASIGDGLTTPKLANRLGLERKMISRRREKPDELAKLTREKDPENKAWRYDNKAKKYYPISE